MDHNNTLRLALLLSLAVLGYCDRTSDLELQLELLARRIDFVHLDSLRLEGTIKSLESRFQSIEAELQGRYLSQDNAGRGGSSVGNDELQVSEKVSQKLAPFYKAFEEEKRLRRIYTVETNTNVDTLNTNCKNLYDQSLSELVEVANNSTMTDEEIRNDVQDLSDEMDSKINRVERSVQDLEQKITMHMEQTDRRMTQLENTTTNLLQSFQQILSVLMKNITHINARNETILQSMLPTVNHALGKPIEQVSAGYRFNRLERIVDGDNFSCTSSGYIFNTRDTTLQINLEHPAIIARIVFIGYKRRFSHDSSINVKVTVRSMDTNSPEQVCGQSTIQKSRDYTPFNTTLLCETPVIGPIVQLTFGNHIGMVYIGLCEVEVYSNK